MSETAETTGWTGAEQMEVLTFELNGELFALEAVAVQEIMDLAPETVVPGAGAFAGAVINFRGKVIPLSDLRVAFAMERGEPTIDSRIVVIEIDLDGEPTLVGLRTDKVHEVTTLARADAEDHLGQRHGEIGGVIHQCVVPWAAAACAAAGVVAAGLPAVGLESDGGAARSTRVSRTATSLRIGAMKLSG